MLLSHYISLYTQELQSKSIALYDTQAKHSPGHWHSSRWPCLARYPHPADSAKKQLRIFSFELSLAGSSAVWRSLASWFRREAACIATVSYCSSQPSFDLLLSVPYIVQCKSVHFPGMAWVVSVCHLRRLLLGEMSVSLFTWNRSTACWLASCGCQFFIVCLLVHGHKTAHDWEGRKRWGSRCRLHKRWPELNHNTTNKRWLYRSL